MRSLVPTLLLLAAACSAPNLDGSGEEEKFLTPAGSARKALPVATDPSTQVWAVTASWGDTSTPAALSAGMAWPASSGLRWDEKFALWVTSLQQIPGPNGTRTFQLTTPYGKTLPMPVLECSEVALMLRAVFASWYGLPFFVEATESGTRIFLGHFGFRTQTGRYSNTPHFRDAYADYSSRGAGALSNWPHDAALRARHLTAADGNAFVGAGAGFGAWADEALLNKRVGYMLLYLLDWFGSMNLADAANAYALVPGALRTGDFLLERWQRDGTGHTLVLKTITRRADGTYDVELAAGGMPREQPVWQDATTSRGYFLRAKCGGPGHAADGSLFAALGGGLRRFRVAVVTIDGYWINSVPAWDVANSISDSDLTDIAARPAQFDKLLGTVGPQQQQAALVRQIESQRTALRQLPASCSRRSDREAAFAALVQLNQQSFGISPAETNLRFRATDDYYFPELRYDQSPTCCWNSTTPQMYAVVDRYNRARESASAQCLTPVPFTKAHYPQFKAYAQSTGAAWRDWSEDESCPQRAAADDTQLASAAVAYCSIRDTLDAEGR